MAERVYSSVEIARLWKTKVQESLILFGVLTDKEKKEVWEYWQDVTHRLETVITKLQQQEESTEQTASQRNEVENLREIIPASPKLDNISAETLKKLAEYATVSCATSAAGSNRAQSKEASLFIFSDLSGEPSSVSYNLDEAHNDSAPQVSAGAETQTEPTTEQPTITIEPLQQKIEQTIDQTLITSTTNTTPQTINIEVQSSSTSTNLTNTQAENKDRNVRVDDADHVYNRKYPERKRKSTLRDSIYSYDDVTVSGTSVKGNKENRKSKIQVAEDGSISCDICGLRLARAASLNAHRRKHTGQRPFKCSICGQGFTTKANMLRHENTHNGIRPYQCDKCPRSFGEKKTLMSHQLTHSGEKPFGCPICGVSFAQKGTLTHHIYRHTGHKGHLCDDCGKSFRQKCQLRAHQLRHKSNPKHPCDCCDKAFYTKGDLLRHKIKHAENKPYVCDICSKSYSRLQYLRGHQNSHKGIKPYHCKECDEKFYESMALYRHSRHHKPKPEKKINRTTLVIGQEFEIPVERHLIEAQMNAVLDATHSNGDVYRITYLQQPATDNVGTMLEIQQSTSYKDADFSAITLLANATTQLTEESLVQP